MFAKILGPDDDQIVVMVSKMENPIGDDSKFSAVITLCFRPYAGASTIYIQHIKSEDYDKAIEAFNNATEEQARLEIKKSMDSHNTVQPK